MVYDLMGREPYVPESYDHTPWHIQVLAKIIEDDYAAMLEEEQRKAESNRLKYNHADMQRARREAIRDYIGYAGPSGLNY